MPKPTANSNITDVVECRACHAEVGQPCIVGATGKKATKSHNVRLADAAGSLVTPDTETADEFSEYDKTCECAADVLGNSWHTESCPLHTPEDDLLGDPEPEATEAAEPITWTEYPAKDVQPGMVIEHKGRPARVAGRRVTAKWVTALDEDLSTLLYVAPDSVVRVWL